MTTTLIRWQPPLPRPDAMITVLVELDGECSSGWWDGEVWYAIDGCPLAEERVTAWADVPLSPMQIEAAQPTLARAA